MPDEPFLPVDPQPTPIESGVLPVSATTETTLAPTGTTTGLPPNIGAALSVFFLLVGGIVFLILERKNSLTRFWAMQSIILGVVWIVVRIAFGVVGALFSHIFAPLYWLWSILALLVSLCFLAVWVVCIYQAFIGKRWEIPVLGPIAREQLARFGAHP